MTEYNSFNQDRHIISNKPTAISSLNSDGASSVVEMLPELQLKYLNKLRAKWIAVRFRQDAQCCYLETIEQEKLTGNLKNVVMRRDDLSFVTSNDDLFFNPSMPIEENVRRFVEDFDEISIANCTDLFTDEAAIMITSESQGHKDFLL